MKSFPDATKDEHSAKRYGTTINAPRIGKVDDDFQQFEGIAMDVPSLMFNVLKDANPILNWKEEVGDDSINPKKMTTWFPEDDEAAFYSSNSKKTTILTYRQLHQKICDFPKWTASATNDNPVVVAILIPNDMMTEMAVALLSVMASPSCTAAPLDPRMSPERIQEAMTQLNCKGLISTPEYLASIHFWKTHNGSFLSEKNQVVVPHLEEVKILDSFTGIWKTLRALQNNDEIEWQPHIPNRDQVVDTVEPAGSSSSPALLLRTSGTTSTPKVVPLHRPALLHNALCIASSLRLGRSDVDLNAMPLFHIGGIACALLSVLVSGSSVIMAGQYDPASFLDILTVSDAHDSEEKVYPTWYYGVPTMHKSLVLVAQSRLHQTNATFVPNKIRLVRSGAAHLSHNLALDLSKVLNTAVLPTYSMSECMPVCSSSTPIQHNVLFPQEIIDTVGPPIGPSVRIVNEEGKTLPHGSNSVGEVVINGPGVIPGYIGIPKSKTHTPDGWLKTGDVGLIDCEGRLFLRGRTKEMIKRGGEQVWPNQIDDAVEKMDGVTTAVAFGVPNELWGEEVAVAVVLEGSVLSAQEKDELREFIVNQCREELDSAAVPRQVVMLSSVQDLPRGPTGKYLRSKMASHFGLQAVDTGALVMMETGVNTTVYGNVMNSPDESVQTIAPSQALNGLRFLTVCFVAQGHLGLFPSSAWLKIQSYSLNMIIFFVLGAFQLSTSVTSPVLDRWANFVGTKIGSMHALFIITQLIAIPSFFLFERINGGYKAEDGDASVRPLVGTVIVFAINTVTGLLGAFGPNSPTWFQSAFYLFLTTFPWLDKRLRMKRPGNARCILAVCLIANMGTLILISIPELFLLFFNYLSWMPVVVAAIIAGHFFQRSPAHEESQNMITSKSKLYGSGRAAAWGIVADVVSIVLLLITFAVVNSPGCSMMTEETFKEMRPGEDIPDDQFEYDGKSFVRACDLTYDEFVDYAHPEPEDPNDGRLETDLGSLLGFIRLGTPLVLLWLYALAFDRGLTARFLQIKPLQMLSPLTYPVYLLHVPVSRYYWLATRGADPEFWWRRAAEYIIPVDWYEFFIILAISTLLGWFINKFLVPNLMPHTVKLGTDVCSFLSRRICMNQPSEHEEASSDDSTMMQVERMVKGLTGAAVSRSTLLNTIGLDSLGAAALLGTLRMHVPKAKKLTVQEVAKFKTVGDLVNHIDNVDAEFKECLV